MSGHRSLPLLAMLALGDIVGESIARGRFFITLNVAAIVLVLATRLWHRVASMGRVIENGV